MAYPPRTEMRAQINTQIAAWGVVCDIQRFSPSTDATGRKTGAWASLVSGGVHETMWIQPYVAAARGGNSDIAPQGLNAETTHIAFQTHTGTAMIPKDRIVVSGETYVYDVLESQIHETHKEVMLKQVRRV